MNDSENKIMKNSITSIDENALFQLPVLNQDYPYAEYITFWSLEDAYSNEKLRYHLGQVYMLEIMNRLVEEGAAITALICDSDGLETQFRRYEYWMEQTRAISRTIELLSDRSVSIQRLSSRIQHRKRENPNRFKRFRLEISEAILLFRDEVRDFPLSESADRDIHKYRMFLPDESIPKSLAPLVAKLQRKFQIPPYILLPAAYAFIHRPNWFSTAWFADVIACLVLDDAGQNTPIILESQRNAYSWLVMACIFEIAKTDNDDLVDYFWPTTLFVPYVPSIGGDYMNLNSPEACIFLDSTDEELSHQVKSTPNNIRSQYNKMILDDQSQVSTSSPQWDEIFIKKIQRYRKQLQELLIHYNNSDHISQELSAASQNSESIHYDVFLCHNTDDKPFVKNIALKLKERSITSWLDVWEARPGLPWQRILQEQIQTIDTVAVFVGSSGIGPWQQEEIDGFLQEFMTRGCPIIPVLLPDTPVEPVLPPFLKNRTYVDFRYDDPDPIEQLIWGITGTRIE